MSGRRAVNRGDGLLFTLKCVGCRHKLEVSGDPDGELPMCPKCFAPMFVEEAHARRIRRIGRFFDHMLTLILEGTTR